MSFGQSDIACTIIMSCYTICTAFPPSSPTPTDHIINLRNTSGLLTISANFGIGVSILGLSEPQRWLKREGYCNVLIHGGKRRIAGTRYREALWCVAQELSEHMRSVPILVTAIKTHQTTLQTLQIITNGDDGENMNTYRRFAKSPAAHKAPLS